MDRVRATPFGAPLLVALALLAAACTSPAGAGIPGVTSTTAPTEPAAPPPVTAPDPDPGPGFVLPDLTARPLSTADLQAMLPPEWDGAGAADGEPVPLPRTNEDLVTGAVLDRADEVSDVDRFGRVTGVGTAYPFAGGTAYVWIDLLATTEGAAGWAADTAEDIVKRAGGSHAPDIDLAAAEDYPVGVGQDAAGLVLTLDGGARTETAVLFHVGRLAVFASIVRDDGADARVPVQYLAEATLERILSVLQTAATPVPAASGPDSYAFAFERAVDVGATRWTSTASGVVADGAVECRVSLSTPSGEDTADLVTVGSRAWARRGAGDYRPVGTAGALDRQMLALCPAWPIDLTSAGLEGVLAGTPAGHDFGGTAALGYRGTAADLAAAVGVDPETITVDVFNVWVADGTPWVVRLDLSVTGDAAALVQLTGPGFPADGSARVTISQEITSIGAAGPVSPPG